MSKDEEFRKKIHDWLSSQGYPLEMQVSLAFKQSGFSIRQSNFYADPETGESREIDVIATTEDLSWSKYVSYVIECKVSRDKPWVLFTTENLFEGWNIFFTRAVLTEEARNVLIKAFSEDKDNPKFEWLREKLLSGYGLTQAFTSGRDIPHEAIMSVSKGAIARKVEQDKRAGGVFDVIFPVIIIDGRLFECFLDNSCSVQIREIEEGVLFSPRSIGGTLTSCIRLVTIKSLPEFSRKAYEMAKVVLT
ncbi:MAG: hypothetical protein L6277_01015 [Desulfobacterales bacterium]|nr:hypothetical protein [Pseudomonadota bacterium]MCG2770656.1 hypothetical protein [Desulfobacterales bacterium]